MCTVQRDFGELVVFGIDRPTGLATIVSALVVTLNARTFLSEQIYDMY